MLAVWILVALGVGGVALDLFNSSNDDDRVEDPIPDPHGPTDPEDPSDGALFLASDGETLTGTDAADFFALDPDATGSVATTLDGGAGDDVFALDSGDIGIFSTQISGGEGDDLIRADGETSTIEGGSGNDTIEGALSGSRIFGEAGDDSITVQTQFSDFTYIEGGEGNDTLDGRGSDNINLQGGDGDDLILTDGFGSAGAGYVIEADGGDGDDTFRHTFEYFPPRLEDDPSADVPARLYGGNGSDVFEVALQAGNGVYDGDGSEVVTLPILSLEDFLPQQDMLVIDLEGVGIGYSASEASISEDALNDSTTLQITLTSATLPTQNLTISIVGRGMTWDDVAFVNGAPPSLSGPPAI